MYCPEHDTDNNVCGCSFKQIKEYATQKIRLSELDVMEAAAIDANFEELREVVIELIRLLKKERM